MAGVTKEEIAQAKQMDLLTYMKQYEPEELVKVGAHDYKTKTHDSLSISDNGIWNWCSRGKGGTTALNYLILVKGMGFVDAVRYLNGSQATHRLFFQKVAKPEPKKEAVPFVEPTPDLSNRKAAEYLHGRGISRAVLQFCHAEKLLYQTSSGRYANCVFLGRDETGKARSGVIRGCGGKFRGNIPGSEKQYGFCIPAAEADCDCVKIYESPIDAMSGATLEELSKGRAWRSCHYLALGGLNYMAADCLLEHHPKICRLSLCLDNDEAGRVFAAKLTERYAERGYVVENTPAPCGKDYNDTLLQCLGARATNREAR